MLDVALQIAWGVLDLAVFVQVSRGRWGLAAAVAAAGGLGIAVLALIGTGDAFAVMRAGAWGGFVHLPLGLLAVAAARGGVVRWVAVPAAVLLAGIGVDAFLVEPHALEIVRYVVPTTEIAAPLRVVVLSDVQTDRVGDYERGVFEAAAAERPDLIVLPGDFVQVADDAEYARQVAAFRRLLPLLQAPLGVWAVEGNVERPGWADDLFAGTHVRASPSTVTASLGPLTLTALSFRDGFDPDLALPAAPGLHLAFAHGPDFSLSAGVGADVLVAGHTHGGQVQLPLLGPPLVLSRVSREVGAGGRFALPGGRTLVVSRGIGMERRGAPRLRFRCRPQLVVIDLVPEGP